jgi:hypothetical protein
MLHVQTKVCLEEYPNNHARNNVRSDFVFPRTLYARGDLRCLSRSEDGSRHRMNVLNLSNLG